MPEKNLTITEELNAVLEEFTTEKESIERVVIPVDETHILIGDVHYEIIENFREGFDIEAMNNRYQDIFARYDYIVGDWGHDKLRLKGFFKHHHRLATPDRDIYYLQDYLNEYCNFGCKYFVLERDPKAIYIPVEEEIIPKRPKQKSNKRGQRRMDKGNRTPQEMKSTTRKMTPQIREDNFQKNSQPTKKPNLKEATKTNFELKEMTQKETYNKQNSPVSKPKQKRPFSMKEVDQTPKQRIKNSKPTKSAPKKRFDIREKQQKRGKS